MKLVKELKNILDNQESHYLGLQTLAAEQLETLENGDVDAFYLRLHQVEKKQGYSEVLTSKLIGLGEKWGQLKHLISEKEQDQIEEKLNEVINTGAQILQLQNKIKEKIEQLKEGIKSELIHLSKGQDALRKYYPHSSVHSGKILSVLQ